MLCGVQRQADVDCSHSGGRRPEYALGCDAVDAATHKATIAHPCNVANAQFHKLVCAMLHDARAWGDGKTELELENWRLLLAKDTVS